MKRIIDLSNEEAKKHFLKGSSYFTSDIPSYISFEPILTDVSTILGNESYTSVQSEKPQIFSGINYDFLSNKDGKFSWRPLELIHPVIYISLVNIICDYDNWILLQKRWSEFEGGAVECCSEPVVSVDNQTDVASQIKTWWKRIEQQSLIYSLEFDHILHTDVTDCYGSLYTHSISWAIHGLQVAKDNQRNDSLLGNKIDSHIRASRYGQTNGIPQGSVLMDFVAELVLGYVDEQINKELGKLTDFHILRYRDDYRIFTNSDDKAEFILKVISEKLRLVGMKLGVAKTIISRNVVEGSIKPDKLASIDLQDLGNANAKTIQKQLLRLHSFGLRFPNSGSLRRLISEFHDELIRQNENFDDLEVQIAIATDIGFYSPSTFPAIAGILSYLISQASPEEKKQLWMKVRNKMARVPYNGYLEIWLQRVTQPKEIGLDFTSDEPICQIVNGRKPDLWDNDWIGSHEIKKSLDVSKIIVGSITEAGDVIQPEEIKLFKLNAWIY